MKLDGDTKLRIKVFADVPYILRLVLLLIRAVRVLPVQRREGAELEGEWAELEGEWAHVYLGMFKVTLEPICKNTGRHKNGYIIYFSKTIL